MTIVTVTTLCKSFGGIQAVSGVTFQVSAGEMLALIGPNGADKRLARVIIKPEIAAHFNGPGNEHGRMDFRRELAKIRCPVLMMAGEEDPVTPISLSEMTARCIPDHLVRFERLEDCGHNVVVDNPGRVLGAIREFILAA